MRPTKNVDPRLYEFATVRQGEYLKAIEEHGSIRAAARALKVNKSAVETALLAVQRRAAVSGYAPEADMTRPAPAPFVVKGTSTLYDEDGKAKLQWVKTQRDGAQVEAALKEWVGWLVEDARGVAKAIPAPKVQNDDLLVVYPMGDPHFGLYSWASETGNDFDLDIAERLTCGAIDRLVHSAPEAGTALIAELGDFFHADNNSARTERSGAQLDVDTRWARVMQVGLRAMVYVIKKALTKHKRVVVRIVKGNHDTHSSFALALALDAYFANEPRVEVDLSPAVHWYFEFGRVLVGVTHGDTGKSKDLPSVMAADRPEAWGRTQYRYWYQGHIHHDWREEFRGVTVEAFRTLAAADAWHMSEGYRAGRDMRCLVLHKDFGEIERHRCDIAMLTGKQA